MKIKAGYKIEVTSWENDGDNYSTKSKEGLTKEQTQFYFDICNRLSGVFGNMYDPDESEKADLYAAVSDILLKHKDVALELFEAVDFNNETCEEIFSDIHYELFGSSEFYTRQLESISVTYIPYDLVLEDVTHEFMKELDHICFVDLC